MFNKILLICLIFESISFASEGNDQKITRISRKISSSSQKITSKQSSYSKLIDEDDLYAPQRVQTKEKEEPNLLLDYSFGSHDDSPLEIEATKSTLNDELKPIKLPDYDNKETELAEELKEMKVMLENAESVEVNRERKEKEMEADLKEVNSFLDSQAKQTAWTRKEKEISEDLTEIQKMKITLQEYQSRANSWTIREKEMSDELKRMKFVMFKTIEMKTNNSDKSAKNQAENPHLKSNGQEPAQHSTPNYEVAIHEPGHTELEIHATGHKKVTKIDTHTGQPLDIVEELQDENGEVYELKNTNCLCGQDLMEGFARFKDAALTHEKMVFPKSQKTQKKFMKNKKKLDDKQLMKMDCSHGFHRSCIHKYLKKYYRCPICKTVYKNDLDQVSSEITRLDTILVADLPRYQRWFARVFPLKRRGGPAVGVFVFVAMLYVVGLPSFFMGITDCPLACSGFIEIALATLILYIILR